MSLATLKPYAELIRWGVMLLGALVLLGAGVAGGMRWQAGEVAEARAETVKVEGQRNEWRTASQGWELATERWKARYAAEQRQADEMADAAQEALLERDRLEDQAKREIAAWEQRFEDMKRRPDCKVLLEETTCPAFADY